MKRLLGAEFVFPIVLSLGLFAMAARNVTDPDVWWHLKAGQYISEHHSVPRSDPFSYTRAGQPWVAHEWLTEVLLYQIQRVAGWGGLIVIFSGIVAAAFLFLYWRCGPARYVAGVITLAGAWACVPLWGVRPQMLSLLLTSLWLLILERSENNPKLLWSTLPLTLLWVNLHAGFALGIGLSALFLIGGWLERRLGCPQHAQWRKTAAVTVFIDLLLVPVNPNGWRLFFYPLETLRSAAMQNYILEWASPNFHRWEYWPFLGVVLGTFAVLFRSARPVRPRDLLLLVLSLYTGLCSIRMIPLFVLVAVPVVTRGLGGSAQRSDADGIPAGVRVVLNSALVLAMAGFAGWHAAQVIQHQPQAEAQHFPAGAVAFLATHSTPGSVFNHYDWGGYLVWRLYHALRVFIDGRADLYGQELLDQFANTYQFKDGWRQTFQRWEIGTVLVPQGSALATGLRSSPGWSVSYEDAQSVLLTVAAAGDRKEPTLISTSGN